MGLITIIGDDGRSHLIHTSQVSPPPRSARATGEWPQAWDRFDQRQLTTRARRFADWPSSLKPKGLTMFGWSPIPWKLVSYVLAAAIFVGVAGGWLARVGYDRGVAAREKVLLPKIERLTTDLARCEATGDQWEAASNDYKAAVTDMELVTKRKADELREARQKAANRIRTLESAAANLRAHKPAGATACERMTSVDDAFVAQLRSVQ